MPKIELKNKAMTEDVEINGNQKRKLILELKDTKVRCTLSAQRASWRNNLFPSRSLS